VHYTNFWHDACTADVSAFLYIFQELTLETSGETWKSYGVYNAEVPSSGIPPELVTVLSTKPYLYNRDLIVGVLRALLMYTGTSQGSEVHTQ
jgi:hypothetical protein